jgi:hypothetical protein
MTKKNLDTHQLVNELHGASAFFKRPAQVSEAQTPPSIENTQQATQETTSEVAYKRGNPRQTARKSSRENPRSPLTRDEIQEFSFRLRDEFKVKVQAEVPPQ